MKLNWGTDELGQSMWTEALHVLGGLATLLHYNSSVLVRRRPWNEITPSASERACVNLSTSCFRWLVVYTAVSAHNVAFGKDTIQRCTIGCSTTGTDILVLLWLQADGRRSSLDSYSQCHQRKCEIHMYMW